MRRLFILLILAIPFTVSAQRPNVGRASPPTVVVFKSTSAPTWTPADTLTGGALPIVWLDPDDTATIYTKDHGAEALVLASDTSAYLSKITSKGSRAGVYVNSNPNQYPYWTRHMKGGRGARRFSESPGKMYEVWGPTKLIWGELAPKAWTYIIVSSVVATSGGYGTYEAADAIDGYSQIQETSTTATSIYNNNNVFYSVTHAALDTNFHVTVLRKTGPHTLGVMTRFLDGVIDGTVGSMAENGQVSTIRHVTAGFAQTLEGIEGDLIIYDVGLSDADIINKVVPNLKTKYGTP